MGRRPTPENLARQDRLLALLRSLDGFPTSAAELAVRLDETKVWTHRCRCRCGNEHDREWTGRVHASDLMPMLRRLERDGYVEALRMGQRVYWRAVESVENRSGSDTVL